MNRAMGGGGLNAKVGGMMTVALVLAQVLQAAPLRPCPHHTHGNLGASHGTAAPASGEAGVSTEHAERPAHGPGHDEPSHDGPCDCLGACQAPATAQAPARPAVFVLLPIPPRRLAAPSSTDIDTPLAVVPFALPFSRPPPA